MKIVNKSLLKAEEKVILHQTNTKTTRGKGLSKQIFDMYPDANVYKNRHKKSMFSTPGTIQLVKTRNKKGEKRYIINMFGQKYPGKPNRTDDTSEQREIWFRNCLMRVSKIKNLKAIALPYRIGCGLAGGNWNNHKKILKTFASDNPQIKVVLYKFNPGKKRSEGVEKVVTPIYDLSTSVHPSYKKFFKSQKDEIKTIATTLKKDSAKFEIYPPVDLVFNAFNLCPLDEIKCIILGQDPYHNPGEAMGLSFSIKPGGKIPSSLRNILKELKSDGFERENPDLTSWAKQGVLLLNTALTVRKNEPNCYKKLWSDFTEELIIYLNRKTTHIVFVFWGGNAKKYRKYINLKKHRIVESVHPSGLSAHRGFFGSKPFSKVNEHLEDFDKKPIDW